MKRNGYAKHHLTFLFAEDCHESQAGIYSTCTQLPQHTGPEHRAALCLYSVMSNCIQDEVVSEYYQNQKQDRLKIR